MKIKYAHDAVSAYCSIKNWRHFLQGCTRLQLILKVRTSMPSFSSLINTCIGVMRNQTQDLHIFEFNIQLPYCHTKAADNNGFTVRHFMLIYWRNKIMCMWEQWFLGFDTEQRASLPLPPIRNHNPFFSRLLNYLVIFKCICTCILIFMQGLSCKPLARWDMFTTWILANFPHSVSIEQLNLGTRNRGSKMLLNVILNGEVLIEKPGSPAALSKSNWRIIIQKP